MCEKKEEEIEREETTFYMAPPWTTWASWSQEKEKQQKEMPQTKYKKKRKAGWSGQVTAAVR